jgi:chromosomal replication initiation ATPase DnaA
MNKPFIIIQTVSEMSGVPEHWISGQIRETRTSLARMACMYIMADLFIISTAEIGRIFGRHHSTVTKAKQRLQDRIDTEPTVSGFVNEAREAVKLAIK